MRTIGEVLTLIGFSFCDYLTEVFDTGARGFGLSHFVFSFYVSILTMIFIRSPVPRLMIPASFSAAATTGVAFIDDRLTLKETFGRDNQLLSHFVFSFYVSILTMIFIRSPVPRLDSRRTVY
jgi:hypothetical protein